MPETFDPYHKWLGIPPAEQPPNHYRLLAIPLFESDPDVIANAADQRMGHVRSFQIGVHTELSQRLLNEIAAARVCLLDARKKAVYDAALRCKAPPEEVPKAATSAATPVRSGPTLDLELFDLPAAPYHPHSFRRRAVSWRAWAVNGALVLVMAGIAAFVVTRNGNEEKAAPEAGDPLAADATPEPTMPAARPRAGAVKPRKPGSNREEAEREHDGAAADAKEPSPEAEPNARPGETPAAETAATAERRLKQALADAKTLREYRAVAQDSLKVFEQAAADGQADLAKRLATTALVAARKAKDGALADDATLCVLTGRRRADIAAEDDGENAPPAEAPKKREETSLPTRPAAKAPVEAAEKKEIAAAAKPGRDGWMVVFRSADPAIWNSNVNRSKDDFAISLSAVPDDIKYLRMRAAGQRPGAILPMEKTKLAVRSDNGRFGWNGTGYNWSGGRHLGIYSLGFTGPCARGDVSVKPAASGEMNADARGFGFGHVVIINGQGYTWNGAVMPKTVFEIAVKAMALTRKERSELLK